MKSTATQRGTTFYLRDPAISGPEWEKYPVQLHVVVTLYGIELDDHRERLYRSYLCSEDLRAKTALLCAGLIPAAIYADALQEEIPEAEWAAQQLREWAKWTPG